MPLIPWRRRPRRTSMTIVEHLDELRTRLVISLVAITLTSIVGFVFFDEIFNLLLRPYRGALEQLPTPARPPGSLAGKLIYSSPIDPFLTRIKVAFFAGLFIALPV